jgi:hypothetical protein
VTEEVRDVLHDDERWPMPPENPQDVIEEVTVSLASEPQLLTSLREGLAWESRAEDVMLGHGRGTQRTNVAGRSDPKVQRVEPTQFLVLLAGQDT